MYSENNYSRSYYSTDEKRAALFPALMNKVYLWMALALVITAFTSLFVVTQPAIVESLFQNSFLLYGLIAAEIGIVWYLSSRVMSLSFGTAGLLFALYSVLNGLTLSSVFLIYTASSITTTFFISAASFGAMALTGIFIKKDLSAVGRFLFFAVIGLIVASVVNIFLHSEGLAQIMSYAGVLIFAGLTAYDTQKIRNMLVQYRDSDSDSLHKIALMGSLTLYLDFINLFIYLLRLFGQRK